MPARAELAPQSQPRSEYLHLPNGAVGVMNDESFIYPHNAIGPSRAEREYFNSLADVEEQLTQDGFVAIPVEARDTPPPTITPHRPQSFVRVAKAVLPAFLIVGIVNVACGAPEVPGVGGPNPIQPRPDIPAAVATETEKREATAVAAATIQAEQTKPATPPTGSTVAETGAKAPVAPEAVTQEQLLARVDGIIDKIKNPDPELIKKYSVGQKDLEDDQVGLIYGGYVGDQKAMGDKKFLPDSLMGIRAAIEKGDYVGAKKTVEEIYKQLGNHLGDTVVIIMSAAEAEKIDPQHKFLRFASDIPGAKPEFKDKANYTGSEIKRGAAYGMIELSYSLDKPFPGK